MKRIILGTLIFSVIYINTGFTQASEYLMPAKKYGKWGFINKDGDWVIPTKYEKARHFSEGLSAVKFYGHWGYINHKNQWVIQPKYQEAKPFKEGVACVMMKNNWGYINTKGEWHLEPKLKVVSSFSDGKAIIKNGVGFVFINKKGDQIMSQNFDQALPFSEGLAFVVYNGIKGYIDHSGNWLIKHEYEEAYSFSEGLALIKKGTKYGFIDQNGNIFINASYDDANYFKEGLAAVKKKNNWGYINQSGLSVVEQKYEAAFPFFNGLAVVKSNGKFGVINKEGDWVISPAYSGIGRYTKAIALENQVKMYVKSMYVKWQLKGEYEKTSDYLIRVSEEKRASQIREFASQAVSTLANKYVNYKQTTVGLYQADSEKFSVFIPCAQSIMFPIPIDYAKDIKKNWSSVWLGNPSYALSGDEFLVTSLDLKYKGQLFKYNISQDLNTEINPTLDIKFQNIAYNIPQMSVTKHLNLTSPLTIIGRSDVDVNIPITNEKNNKTFALVIGNEDYSSFRMNLNTGINVDFAAVDAKTFNKYLMSTLGVPKENITLLINATAGQMNQHIARLSAIAEAYEGEAKLIFYYAGHGLPKEKTNEPYLIPVDVSSSNLDYALKLEDVFNKLTEHETQRVTVFLDACFSGGGRSHELVAARGVRIKPKSPFVMGNLVVFSASSEDQSAFPYTEKAHGIFTYFLLKGLQISNGKMSYGDLYDFIRTNVMQTSILVNNKIQSPEVKVSPVLEFSWKEMGFLENEDFSSLREMK